MKKKLLISTFISILFLSLGAKAKDGLKELNVSAPFAQLEQRMKLTDEFVDSLRPFANSLPRRLENLLYAASDFSHLEAETIIYNGIVNILDTQTNRFHESLAIEVLERATLIHQVLVEETDLESSSASQVRVRLLTRAIDLVLQKYLGSDIDYLNSFNDIDYFKFGIEYFEYLNELNKSIFDATAQYRIEKLCLEFLRYDFARDLHYQSYATQIVEISDSLVAYPKDIDQDQRAVQSIRALRGLRNHILDSLKDNVNFNGKVVIYRGNLISGDSSNTTYVGIVNSYYDQQLDIKWLRRNGHDLSRELRQTHPLDRVSFEKIEGTRFLAGQVVSKLDFNTNGTRFTRSGRLLHIFEDGTAEVMWTHATGFGLGNGQSQTVHDSNSYSIYLPISELN